MKIRGCKCADCGSRELFAVAPGSDALREAMVMLERGRPGKAWCEKCWMRRWAPKNGAHIEAPR